MQRAFRSLVYLAALVASTAASTLAAAQFLPSLPGGALGFAVAALGVAVAALGVATLERAMFGQAWLRARHEPKPALLRGHSQLLAGQAPLPLATGVVLGALLATRLQ